MKRSYYFHAVLVMSLTAGLIAWSVINPAQTIQTAATPISSNLLRVLTGRSIATGADGKLVLDFDQRPNQKGGDASAPADQGYEVHGVVTVHLSNQRQAGVKGESEILLPDFELFLRNVATGEESPRQKTSLHGHYVFPPVKPGEYELRWKEQKGWDAGVYPRRILVRGHTQYPGAVVVAPRKGFTVIGGRVSLADGGSPWFESALWGVTRTAEVTALDAAGAPVGETVRANFAGDFVVAGILPRAALKIEAVSGESRTAVSLSASALSVSTVSQLAITLRNHRPRVRAVIASRAGQMILTAEPGETLDVEADADDANGDLLRFAWKPQSGEIDGEGPAVRWTLPKIAGTHAVDLLVSDGKGGEATAQLTVVAGSTAVAFSGKVIDSNGRPIQGARVAIGAQKPVESGADGSFRIETKPSRQYVLNIKKQGYALFSRLSDRALSGQAFRLVPAYVQEVDAGEQITLVDKRADLERRKLAPGTIVVPAGALVDSAGNKVAGRLTAEIATLDLAADQMPGDLLGVMNGQEVGIISYGVIWVEFYDAAGQKCQLAAGAEARVIIPIPAAMRSTAPPQMPVWYYDESDGRWKVSGSADLDPAAGVYRGKVTHLSTINMDQSGPVSCLRIHTDVSLPAGLILRVRDVPGEGVNFAQVKQMVLDGEQNTTDGPLNAVFRVPALSRVQFDVLDVEGNPVPDNLVIVEDGDTRLVGALAPLAQRRVTAGPASADLWPAYPYTGCKDVTLKLRALWGGYPSSPFLTRKEIGSSAVNAANYYTAVDPLNNRTTLEQWWSQNGFDATGLAPAGPNYSRTSYLNNNDLGSGRDMHFLKHADNTLSAYVVNYSRGVAFDQRHSFANDARDHIQQGATVCMEYKPVEGAVGADAGRPIVKFFVYADLDPGIPGTERQLAANLDGFGAKFVPNLCLNCHGGNYSPSSPPTFAQIDMGSSFRELDYATYKFPDGRVAPNVAEKDAFKRQNKMIEEVTTALPGGPLRKPVARGPIVDLIHGWYLAGTSDQNNNYTPTTTLPDHRWDGTAGAGLYHDVVKVSCRTCHIAFDSADDQFGLDWNRYDQMVFRNSIGSLQDFVIGLSIPPAVGTERIMPHALVTYRNFWVQRTPGFRPQQLWSYSDGAVWPAIGAPAP